MRALQRSSGYHFRCCPKQPSIRPRLCSWSSSAAWPDLAPYGSASRAAQRSHARAATKEGMQPLDPALLAAAQTDAPHILTASEVPVLDLGAYLADGSGAEALAQQLGDACADGGYFFIRNHGVALEDAFAASRSFHALPLADKVGLSLDATGSGYLGLNLPILPVVDNRGNLNTAFMMMNEGESTSSQWPSESTAPGFRTAFSACTAALHRTSRGLLPLFARALRLQDPDSFFDTAFTGPLSYTRMSHYPSAAALRALGLSPDADQFGVAPHWDTGFLTLSDVTQPGLCVWHGGVWQALPVVPGALLVTVGALLQRWTNDTFHAPVHHVRNTGDVDRYSALFFYYPASNYVVACLPGCSGPDRPAKYAALSYLQSQGMKETGFKSTGRGEHLG